MPQVSARKIEKSIAILPFENFSDDKANAYFADGIQDDVLTNLAKISDLKVISRTSVMQYRGQQHNLREIGKALGRERDSRRQCAPDGQSRPHQRAIDRCEHDRHLWAEDYDRDLTDVFAIQSDLAQKIAQELQAKLSPNEKEQLTRKPTENGEAYLAFVQARNLYVREDNAKVLQANSFMNAPCSSIRILRWPQQVSRNWRAGFITVPTRQTHGGTRRGRWQTAPCSYSPICRRGI